MAASTEDDNIQDDSAVGPAPKNMFEAARAKRKKAAAPMVDELEHYLAAEPDVTIENTLAWWASPERRAMYPALSRMARCYLTIPRKFNVFRRRLVSNTDDSCSHVRRCRTAVQQRPNHRHAPSQWPLSGVNPCAYVSQQLVPARPCSRQ